MFIKIIILLVTSILFCSCKSSSKNDVNSNSDNKLNLTTNCPENGSCTFEIIPNSSMNILTDDTGALYPQFQESDAFILKFEYTRDEQPDIEDDGYSELIYLEINKDISKLELTNSELDHVKLLFARLCYCRGASGYYKIRDGHLTITKKENNEYHMDLSFQTNEVPQIIKRISETFIIK